jgi:hypothetical protein
MRSSVIILLLGAAAVAAAAAQETAFVPGSRTLLADDFAELRQGGALRQWKIEGASAKPGSDGGLIAAAEMKLFPKIAAWPQAFTVEQDFTMVNSDDSDIEWFIGDADGNQLWKIWVRFNDKDQSCVTHLEGDTVEYGSAEEKCAPGSPLHLNFAFDKGHIRIFLNGRRALAGSVRPDRPGLVSLLLAPAKGGSVALSRIRIAE